MQIPERKRDLAAPSLPATSPGKQAAGLDMAGGWDHSLAELLSEPDCSAHRGELPLG